MACIACGGDERPTPAEKYADRERLINTAGKSSVRFARDSLSINKQRETLTRRPI